MKFTEAQLEQAFIELLEKEGFQYAHGESIPRNSEEVLKSFSGHVFDDKAKKRFEIINKILLSGISEQLKQIHN